MASAAEYEAMMNEALNQVNAMTPVNQSDIAREFMNRVDNFRPLYDDLSTVEAQAYASPATLMQGYNEQFGYGANANGPSALQRMSSIMGNIGQQMGTSDTLANIISTQRGRVEDLAKSAGESYNNQRAAVQDRYNMLSPLYQAAMQREEAERARAAQAAQMAAMYGGYGQDYGQQSGGGQPSPSGTVSAMNPKTGISAVNAGFQNAFGNVGQNAYTNNFMKDNMKIGGNFSNLGARAPVAGAAHTLGKLFGR